MQLQVNYSQIDGKDAILMGARGAWVIGHSFARDWINVLLESKYKDNLDISYISSPFKHKELTSRAQEADVIFYSTAERSYIKKLGIDPNYEEFDIHKAISYWNFNPSKKFLRGIENWLIK